MKLQRHLPLFSKSLKRHLEDLLQCPVASVYESEDNIMLVYPESYEVPVSVVKVGPDYESQPWKSQLLTVSLGVHNPVFDDVPEVVRARRIALDHINMATA